MNDARRMGRLLAFAESEGLSIPDDELCNAIGLESLLSLEKARSTSNYKRRHIQAVLSSQYTCNPDQLGCISQQSSKLSQDWASALAAGYWNMLR